MVLRALPLGISSFRNLRKDERIYVDKTDLIFSMVQNQSRVFLARPRRFGKSLLVSTLEALFSRGLEDFQGLKIEKLWKDNKQYKVVRLDFSEISSIKFERFELNFSVHLINAFGQFGFECDEYRLPVLLGKLSIWLRQQELGSFVLLVDEYDSPLTTSLNDSELFTLIREDLSQFFSIIKSQDSAFRFIFITGITKFNKTSIFSAFNNLTDISLIPEYGDIVGYRHDEVKKYFSGYIEKAAKELEVDSEDLFGSLVRHYDGFCFEETAKIKVFAPWSLLSFFTYPGRGFRDYWFESAGQPRVLIEYLKSHNLRDPLNFTAAKSISMAQLAGASDVESLTDVGLLTQTGYLTIKSVSGETIFVDYPNDAVRQAMAALYLQVLLGKTIEQAGVRNLAFMLAKENPETLVHTFNRLLESIDYKDYAIKDEASLRAVLQVAIVGAGLSPKIECHNAHGRSDLEVTAGERHIVLELKYCDCGYNSITTPKRLLKEAVEQMEKRRYGMQTGEKELLRIALVFSESERRITEWSVVPPLKKLKDDDPHGTVLIEEPVTFTIDNRSK